MADNSLRALQDQIDSIIELAEQRTGEPLPTGRTRQLGIYEWNRRRMETAALNALIPDPLSDIKKGQP